LDPPLPHRFQMEPEAQWRAMWTIAAHGDDILAIYHSHPTGPGTPSLTDAREWRYPEALLILWAPVGTTWIARAFRWVEADQDFVEVPLRIG